MDAFVKHFFPQFSTPGAVFRFDDVPSIWTYADGEVNTTVRGTVTPTQKTIHQRMTPLGKLIAEPVHLMSTFDGITKEYLTPEGTLKFEQIAHDLKTAGGYSNQDASRHIALAMSMSWSDNHTALILNMLRYVFLMRVKETRGNLNGALGTFTEEDMIIDMDQWWGTQYPAESAFTTWPVQPQRGADGYEYVEVHQLLTAALDTPADVLDLRANSPQGALFVLKMLNQWRRSSRMRLDYDTGKLTHAVYYRGPGVVDDYDRWAERQELGDLTMISSSEAWTQLKAYVCQNRVYENFSTALYLFCTMAYQYVPETAEGTYWVKMAMRANIPAFSSIRGRYPFFNTGEAAFLNQRPLDEWNYISGKLEKLNLMALVWSQAYYMGLTIRSMRRGFEDQPDDLDFTAPSMVSVDTRTSAAVSEFVRVAAPLAGIKGVSVKFDEDTEAINTARHVHTRNADDAELPSAHKYGADTVFGAPLGPVRVRPTTLPAGPAREAAIAMVALKKATLQQARELDPECDFGEEFSAALEDCMVVKNPRPQGNRVKTVLVPVLPMPGWPTFLLPTQPTSYPTPFMGEGLLDSALGHFTKNMVHTSITEAWRLVSYMSSVGYSMAYEIRGTTCGPTEFLAGRTSGQIWPILFEPEDTLGKIVFKGQTRAPGTRLTLPPVHSQYLLDTKISYKHEIYRRGVSAQEFGTDNDIQDFGGATTFHITAPTMTVSVTDEMRNIRGFYSRQTLDFRFAPYVRAGVIPDASAAAPEPEGGEPQPNANAPGAEEN
nr:putative capsid protein [Poaceae Liege totivirus 4]